MNKTVAATWVCGTDAYRDAFHQLFNLTLLTSAHRQAKGCFSLTIDAGYRSILKVDVRAGVTAWQKNGERSVYNSE